MGEFIDLDKRIRSQVDEAAQVQGAPPNWGQSILPQIVTFQGLTTTMAKVYRPSDEALRDSYESARHMLSDVTITECLEQRYRSTALLDWHIESEDERDPRQKELASEVQGIIECIPRFMQFRENLLRAIWFGKYAVQYRWRWQHVRGKWRVVPVCPLPVHGDKLVFRYEDADTDEEQVGIRVGPGLISGLVSDAIPRERASRILPVDWGMAYFLTPPERRLMTIHKHMIEDGSYEDPLSAGRINGVGIRDRIYWCWYQKQSVLAWLMEFLERSASGFEIWFYPVGNAEAKKKTEEAARQRVGHDRNVIIAPRDWSSTQMASPVERIEPGMAGAEQAKSILQDYFGHLIKRYILGQTLTSEAAGTGLGSNLASIHLDTYMQIVHYDATNVEESLTDQLVRNVQLFNYPRTSHVRLRFRINTQAPDVESKLQAWRNAFEMGLKIKAQDVRDLVGASKPDDEDEVLASGGGQPTAMSHGFGPGIPPAVNDEAESNQTPKPNPEGLLDGRQPLSSMVSGQDSEDYSKWVTIGGHADEEEGKKHVGGFPVRIREDGTIEASRVEGLQGKNVKDVKEHFADSRKSHKSRDKKRPDDKGNITAGPEGLAAKGIEKLSDFGKPKGEKTPDSKVVAADKPKAATVEDKVKKLTEIKEANYAARGEMNPKAAAAYAVEGILNMYRGQPQYISDLLDEEIEDAIKAGNAYGNQGRAKESATEAAIDRPNATSADNRISSDAFSDAAVEKQKEHAETDASRIQDRRDEFIRDVTQHIISTDNKPGKKRNRRRADDIPDASFPKHELAQGQQHEKEHTDNPEIAKEIAKDHLAEDSQYYDKLDALESGKPAPTKEEINQRVMDNQGLVHKAAWGFAKKNPRADVDDLAQEGQLALMRAAELYDESKGKFSTYATHAIKNAMLRHLQQKTVSTESLEADPVAPVAELGPDRHEQMARMMKSLGSLPVEDADLLRRLGGLDRPAESLEQVAKSLGIAKATVAVRRHKAIAKLRSAVERERYSLVTNARRWERLHARYPNHVTIRERLAVARARLRVAS